MTRFHTIFRISLLVAGLAVPVASAAQQAASSSVIRAAQARVEPGDRIVMTVHREPQLSTTVMVDARGDIAVPKVGLVPVANYNILAVQDTLRARFGAFLREPAVEVVVLRRVVVNGEVLKPGVYYVDIGTATLSDAVALAGGITPTGHTERVSIIRGGTRIHVPDWEDSSTLVADLRSGDQVVVGRRSWYALNSAAILGGLSIVATLLYTIVTK